MTADPATFAGHLLAVAFVSAWLVQSTALDPAARAALDGERVAS